MQIAGLSVRLLFLRSRKKWVALLDPGVVAIGPALLQLHRNPVPLLHESQLQHLEPQESRERIYNLEVKKTLRYWWHPSLQRTERFFP